MAEGQRLSLYTIPIHRAFADALAVGLIRRFGGDRLALAQGMVLVPTNRAKRTVQEAFVRASGGGLLVRDTRSAAGKMAWLDYERAIDELLTGAQA